jgi:hypothetical protein
MKQAVAGFCLKLRESEAFILHMQSLLKLAVFAAIAPIAVFASDVESRGDVAFQRKAEKNAALAKRLATRLSNTSEKRKARDTRDVPYMGNNVSAFVRRVEKQKVRDSKLAAEKKRDEEELRQRQESGENNWIELFASNEQEVRKRKHRHR